MENATPLERATSLFQRIEGIAREKVLPMLAACKDIGFSHHSSDEVSLQRAQGDSFKDFDLVSNSFLPSVTDALSHFEKGRLFSFEDAKSIHSHISLIWKSLEKLEQILCP